MFCCAAVHVYFLRRRGQECSEWSCTHHPSRPPPHSPQVTGPIAHEFSNTRPAAGKIPPGVSGDSREISRKTREFPGTCKNSTFYRCSELRRKPGNFRADPGIFREANLHGKRPISNIPGKFPARPGNSRELAKTTGFTGVLRCVANPGISGQVPGVKSRAGEFQPGFFPRVIPRGNLSGSSSQPLLPGTEHAPAGLV